MKKPLVIISLAAIFLIIGFLFWQNELVYTLPTPVPVNYKSVKEKTIINLPTGLHLNNSKPVFLHFFNPDCPCSRFNIIHFKSLVKQYGNDATFAVVIMNTEKYSAAEIQNKFKLNIPVLSDTSLAALCGVYSTPQAVIIDVNKKLHYRGNYNRSRYCTDKKSNYAQQALDSLLNNNHISFNQNALKAYGCSLPNCSK